MDIYIFLRLNKEKVEFLNRLIIGFEIEVIINSLLIKKSLGLEGFIVRFY